MSQELIITDPLLVEHLKGLAAATGRTVQEQLLDMVTREAPAASSDPEAPAFTRPVPPPSAEERRAREARLNPNAGVSAGTAPGHSNHVPPPTVRTSRPGPNNRLPPGRVTHHHLPVMMGEHHPCRHRQKQLPPNQTAYTCAGTCAQKSRETGQLVPCDKRAETARTCDLFKPT